MCFLIKKLGLVLLNLTLHFFVRKNQIHLGLHRSTTFFGNPEKIRRKKVQTCRPVQRGKNGKTMKRRYLRLMWSHMMRLEHLKSITRDDTLLLVYPKSQRRYISPPPHRSGLIEGQEKITGIYIPIYVIFTMLSGP